jgi:hypothetical protein
VRRTIEYALGIAQGLAGRASEPGLEIRVPAGDSEDFAVAVKVAKSFFESSNCEHQAILRKAHHLCKIGDGRGWKL